MASGARQAGVLTPSLTACPTNPNPGPKPNPNLAYYVPAVERLEVGQPLDAVELGADAVLLRVGVRLGLRVKR